MVADDKSVVIKISGDAKAYQDELDKVSKETADLEGQLSKLSKISGAAFAGLTASIGFSVAAYADAEKVQNRVNATIKATGGAAGVTSKQVFDLATSLESVTTFGDEAIASASGILLSFKRIGSDVFPQATEAALDLATRLGIDATSAAQVLGKALNNPIEGLGALRKAGIDFTDAQEKQIKAMVAAGDVAGAQKIVLKELATTMGGLARAEVETTTGAFLRLKEAFGNVAEEVGANFAPAFKLAAESMTGVFQYVKENPQVTKLIAAFALGATVVTGLGTAFGVGALAVLKFRAAMIAAQVSTTGMSLALRGLLAATGIGLLAVIAAEVALNWNTVWPRMQKVFAAFASSVSEIASGVGGVLSAAFRFDFGALKTQLAQLKTILKKGYDDAFSAIPERKTADAGIGVDTSAKYKAGLVSEVAAKQKAEDDKAAIDTKAKAKEAERARANAAVRKLESEQASEQLIALVKEESAIKIALLEAQTQDEKDQLNARFEQVEALLEEQREIESEQRQALRDDVLAQNEEFNALTEDQQRQYLQRSGAMLQSSIDTQKLAQRKYLDEKLKTQIGSNNQTLQDQIKYGIAYAEVNRVIRDTDVGRSVTYFTSLTRLQQSNLGVLKTIGKAAALAQIAMDTARGATQALYAFPIPIVGPALGLAAAAAIVAFGVEQAARVTGIVGAADGGVMIGGMRGVDSIPTMTMPGELITPTRNFDEVVNAVARERAARGELQGVSATVQPEAGSGKTEVVVRIDLSRNASQLITAKQIEDRALGLSREAS
jgi:hypothetical protein